MPGPFSESDFKFRRKPATCCRDYTSGEKNCWKYYVAKSPGAFGQFAFMDSGVLCSYRWDKTAERGEEVWWFEHINVNIPIFNYVVITKSHSQIDPKWRVEVYAGIYEFLWQDRLVAKNEPIPSGWTFGPPMFKGVFVAEPDKMPAGISLYGFHKASAAANAHPGIDIHNEVV